MNFPLVAVVASLVGTPPLFSWEDGFTREAAKTVDVAAIVKPLSDAKTEVRTRKIGSVSDRFDTWSFEAEGIAGVGMDKGATCRLVCYVSHDPQAAFSIDRSKRYLVVGKRPIDGELRFASAEGRMTESTLKAGDREIAAFMILETSADKLPDDSGMADLITAASMDALAVKSDANCLAACRFMSRAVPVPGEAAGTSARPISHCPDNRFTDRLKAIAASETPMRKSLIWGLLARWRVIDAAPTYVAMLAQLAKDPRAYGEQKYRDDVLRSNDLMALLAAEQIHRFKPEEWLNLVLGARNEFLRAYFLQEIGVPLTQKEMARLAVLLNHPSVRVRYWVAFNLSRQNGDEKHEPKAFSSWETDLDSPDNFPNLDEVCEYWRRYYGIRSP